jgi:hypothetical protein
MTTYCELGPLDGVTVSGGRPDNLIDLANSYSVEVGDGELGDTPISTQGRPFLRVHTEGTAVFLSRAGTPTESQRIHIPANSIYVCWVGNLANFYLLPIA